MAHKVHIIEVEKLLELFPNRYEAIMVANQEALRLNMIYRNRGETPPQKITTIALQRIIDGRVKYELSNKEKPNQSNLMPQFKEQPASTESKDSSDNGL